MNAFVIGFMLAGIGWAIYAVTVGRNARRAADKRRHPSNATSYPRIKNGEWV